MAKNDFVLQTLADLSGHKVIRPVSTEVTAMGCLFMTGLASGINSLEKINNFWHSFVFNQCVLYRCMEKSGRAGKILQKRQSL